MINSPPKETVFTLFFFFLLQLSCVNDPDNKTPVQRSTTIDDSFKSKSLLKRVSTFNDNKEILVTYFVADTSNWDVIKTKLLEIKDQFITQNPNVKTISLVCYTSLPKTPIVKTNPMFAWNHEVNKYRACALDNNTPTKKWRFSYGGIAIKKNLEGKWRLTTIL